MDVTGKGSPALLPSDPLLGVSVRLGSSQKTRVRGERAREVLWAGNSKSYDWPAGVAQW